MGSYLPNTSDKFNIANFYQTINNNPQFLEGIKYENKKINSQYIKKGLNQFYKRNNQLQTDNKILQNKIKDYEQQLRSKQRGFKLINQSNQREVKFQKDQTYQNLNEKINTLNNIKLNLQRQINSLLIQNQSYEKETISLKRQIYNYNEKINALNNIKLNVQEKINSLSTQNKSYEKEITSLKWQIYNYNLKINELNGYKSNLEKSYDQIDLKQQITENKLNKKSKEYDQVVFQNNDQQKKINQLSIQNKSYEKEITSLKEQIYNYTLKINELNGYKSNLEKSYYQIYQKQQITENKLNKKSKEYDQVVSQNNEMILKINCLQKAYDLTKKMLENTVQKVLQPITQQMFTFNLDFLERDIGKMIKKVNFEKINNIMATQILDVSTQLSKNIKSHQLSYLQSKLFKQMKRKVQSFKLLYTMDLKINKNFHKYINGVQNILLIVHLETGNKIAGFSQTPVNQQPYGQKAFGGFLASLTSDNQFTLRINREGRVANPKIIIPKEQQYVIFGNYQLKLQEGIDYITSNIQSIACYFDAQDQGITLENFLGRKKLNEKKKNNYQMNQRQEYNSENNRMKIISYDFYQVIFEKK